MITKLSLSFITCVQFCVKWHIVKLHSSLIKIFAIGLIIQLIMYYCALHVPSEVKTISWTKSIYLQNSNKYKKPKIHYVAFYKVKICRKLLSANNI